MCRNRIRVTKRPPNDKCPHPPPWVVPRSQMPRNAGGLGTSCKLIGRPKPPMWDDLFVFNFFSIHRHFWAFGTAGRAMPGGGGGLWRSAAKMSTVLRCRAQVRKRLDSACRASPAQNSGQWCPRIATLTLGDTDVDEVDPPRGAGRKKQDPRVRGAARQAILVKCAEYLKGDINAIWSKMYC